VSTFERNSSSGHCGDRCPSIIPASCFEESDFEIREAGCGIIAEGVAEKMMSENRSSLKNNFYRERTK